MTQEGDFVLKNKNPLAEPTAIRRMGDEEQRAAYEAGKKKKASDAEKELASDIAARLVPEWLKKLEEQVAEPRSRGGLELRVDIFVRWARRSGALTKELPESEYLRIAAGDETPRTREEVLQALQSEQLTTYRQWLQYTLVDEGKGQYEPWFRYLVLSEITKRDDRGRRRDAETTSGVLPLSMSALARVRDDFTPLIAVYEESDKIARAAEDAPEGETVEEAEVRKERRKLANKAKTDALNALTSYPFHEKYLGYVAEETQAENERLNYTNGWHTFTDAAELARVSRGTPWCLAGLKVAQDYLAPEESKLRVYFEDGRPKIAAHVVGEEVREVRGANDSQNLDPAYADIVEEELAQYDNSATWEAQAEDARMLGAIFVLCHDDPQAPLSAEQLRFLYEVDRPIKSFGYDRDERIDNIRGNRSLGEDVRVMFGGDDRSHVATDIEDISDATILWNNELSPEIIEKLAVHGVEHVYTAFPHGRVRISRLSVDAEAVSGYKEAFAERGLDVSSEGIEEMLESDEFKESIQELPKDMICVEVTPQALGFEAGFDPEVGGYVDFEEVKERARELGLEPMTAAAVPAFLLQDRRGSRELVVCMEPIAVEGSPNVFVLFLDGESPLLSYRSREPGDEVEVRESILFMLRPAENA